MAVVGKLERRSLIPTRKKNAMFIPQERSEAIFAGEREENLISPTKENFSNRHAEKKKVNTFENSPTTFICHNRNRKCMPHIYNLGNQYALVLYKHCTIHSPSFLHRGKFTITRIWKVVLNKISASFPPPPRFIRGPN